MQLKRFSEADAAYVAYQLLYALNYMHKQNIVHRDMKPENVLLESKDPGNWHVKITDFGFSKCYDPMEGGLQETLGSPLYMAPEIVKKLPYDYKVDIWSLGVMIYIILSGNPPFKGRSKEDIFVAVTTANINYIDGVWGKISPQAKDFIKRMLIRDPKQRATAEELLKHDWITYHRENPDVEKNDLIEISLNLQHFKKNTTF